MPWLAGLKPETFCIRLVSFYGLRHRRMPAFQLPTYACSLCPVVLKDSLPSKCPVVNTTVSISRCVGRLAHRFLGVSVRSNKVYSPTPPVLRDSLRITLADVSVTSSDLIAVLAHFLGIFCRALRRNTSWRPASLQAFPRSNFHCALSFGLSCQRDFWRSSWLMGLLAALLSGRYALFLERQRQIHGRLFS